MSRALESAGDLVDLHIEEIERATTLQTQGRTAPIGFWTPSRLTSICSTSIEPDVQNRMQKVLNDYRAGVLVLQVQLQSVDAPSEVLSAYRDVTAAQRDQQRAVNEAETYANKVLPEAEGAAARIKLEAQAYRQQTVAEATGHGAQGAALVRDAEELSRLITEAVDGQPRPRGSHAARAKRTTPGIPEQ